LSDHLPVTLKLSVTTALAHGVRHRAKKDAKLTKLHWDKAKFMSVNSILSKAKGHMDEMVFNIAFIRSTL